MSTKKRDTAGRGGKEFNIAEYLLGLFGKLGRAESIDGKFFYFLKTEKIFLVVDRLEKLIYIINIAFYPHLAAVAINVYVM